MANVTMELIKELREKTQVGMMDCKKALVLAEGNLEKAIEILRKKGAAVAEKRADHATNNGIIASYVSDDNKIGALLEIECETDFAANTQDMQKFAKTICEHIAQTKQSCSLTCGEECMLEQKLYNNEKMTIKMLLDDLTAKISENIKLSQCARFETEKDGLVNVYIHPGSTLGVIIELDVEGLTDTNRDVIKTLARDLCMQIAVTNPLCIKPDQLDKSLIEKEKNIIKEQLVAEGKPYNIIEKIMIGKINKYYEEVCLIKQKYIKQDKISIEKYINEIEKANNCKISIKSHIRFIIGK